MQAGRLTGAAEIGIAAGKVISNQIDQEAAPGGFYVLRTPIPAAELDTPGVVTAYKNLKYAGRDFRHIKSDDLDLRPVFHRLEERVKAHVLICMLACYLTWHLRKAWAPLTLHRRAPARPRHRNDVRFAGATATVPMLADPTSAQREAFDLIGVPIPLALK